MFHIQKSNIGVAIDYLVKAEEQHNSAYQTPNAETYKQFLNENKSKNMTAEMFNDYLNQQNEHYKARFIGGLKDKMNLGEYSKEKYTDLMNNKLPKGIKYDLAKKNGHLITQKENASTGTDTISTVPKSVSVHFANGSKEEQDKIVNALNETTEQMFKQVANQVKPSCKDDRYSDVVPGSCNLLITSFVHYESRGYVDEKTGDRRLDPHLHTHNSLHNQAEFQIYKHDENGKRILDEKGNYLTETKMLAIDPEQVFKKQLENSAFFDTLLNSNLQKQGFKTEPADEMNQTFRLTGYTSELEQTLSSRKIELKKFIEKEKKKGIVFSSGEHAETAYEHSVRKNTAISKEQHTAKEIYENIKETVRLNVNADELANIVNIQKQAVQTFSKPDLLKIVKSDFFENEGVVDETKIRAEILKQVRFVKTYNSIDELNKEVDNTLKQLQTDNSLNDKRVIKMENGKYTRLDVALNERALQNNIKSLISHSIDKTKEQIDLDKKLVSNYYEKRLKDGFKLNDNQLESIKLAIISNRMPITMCIGSAGSGKTSTYIHSNVQYNLERNVPVFGISVGTTQAKELKDANIKEENCLNTKQFISKAFILNKETGEPTNQLNQKFLIENKNAVLFFDESGMAGSADLYKITQFVKEARKLDGSSQLHLIGDDKQLQAISAGQSFGNIKKLLPDESITLLDVNTRQKNEVAKSIAENYKTKNIDKVFETLKENNLLKTNSNNDKLIDDLVKNYLNNNEKSKVILASTNADIDKINDKVRFELKNIEDKKPLEERTIDYNNSVSISVSRNTGNKLANQTSTKERSFAVGEEIIFLKNSNFEQKKNGLNISNSDNGTIKSIKASGEDNYKLEVEIKGKLVSFETNDYNNFNHNFAISIYKSQGKTVEDCYVYCSSANLTNYNNSYVAGSRHKNSFELYINSNEVEKYKTNAVREQVKATTLNDKNCDKAVDDYTFKKVNELRIQPKPMPEHLVKNLDKEIELKKANEFVEKVKEQARIEMKKQAEFNIAKNKELNEILVKTKTVNDVERNYNKKVDVFKANCREILNKENALNRTTYTFSDDMLDKAVKDKFKTSKDFEDLSKLKNNDVVKSINEINDVAIRFTLANKMQNEIKANQERIIKEKNDLEEMNRIAKELQAQHQPNQTTRKPTTLKM